MYIYEGYRYRTLTNYRSSVCAQLLLLCRSYGPSCIHMYSTLFAIQATFLIIIIIMTINVDFLSIISSFTFMFLITSLTIIFLYLIMTYFLRTLKHSTTYFLKGRKPDYAPNTSKSPILATCQICQQRL
jgi:hypothetical protein